MLGAPFRGKGFDDAYQAVLNLLKMAPNHLEAIMGEVKNFPFHVTSPRGKVEEDFKASMDSFVHHLRLLQAKCPTHLFQDE